MRLLQDFLETTAQRLPDKVAVVCGELRWSYRDIDDQADRLARGLAERGLNRGDRVVIYLGNTIEAVVALFAVLKAGAVFVMVNRSTKARKLAYILSDSRAAWLIADDRTPLTELGAELKDAHGGFAGAIVCGGGELLEGLGRPVVPWCDAVADGPGRLPRSCIDLDLACLIYTSGTTGEPKGVMCDHGNMMFVSASIAEYLENREDDVVLNVLPLAFGYGLYQLLVSFRVGGTLVLENSFAFPAAILERMQQERVTGLAGVPTVFSMLLQLDSGRFDLTGLRYLTNAGAALPPSHLLELHRRFAGVKVYSMYGLTEAVRALYLPPEWIERKPDSVGVAIPGTEVWLEDGGRRLGPGEVGELVVRGRHVMRGYWNAPELTAVRFRPGAMAGERLCYTGDLFRTDDAGFFYFVGRQDDIIKSRGEKVAPREVESVLHALAGVTEAAVIGVADPVLGQAVKACIVRHDGELSQREVLAHCRANLEDFMVPKYVEFLDALPKSPSGKVLKRELG
jgi:amino acid adenylation domain-containing protein